MFYSIQRKVVMNISAFCSYISFTIMSSHPFGTNNGNYDEMFLTFYLGFIVLGAYQYYSYQHLASSEDEAYTFSDFIG